MAKVEPLKRFPEWARVREMERLQVRTGDVYLDLWISRTAEAFGELMAILEPLRKKITKQE